MMEPLIPPRINLNGTSRQSLLADYVDALDALRKVMEALAAIVPNGRDYQTMDEGACTRARDAFAERQAAIRQVHSDLQTVAEAIADQPDNRRTTGAGQ